MHWREIFILQSIILTILLIIVVPTIILIFLFKKFTVGIILSIISIILLWIVFFGKMFLRRLKI